MKISPYHERRSSPFILSLLAALALTPGCARNPVSGRPEFTVISAAEERRIGAEQAAELVRTIGLVDNPAGLGTYVQAVGRRLASKSPRQDVTYTLAAPFTVPSGTTTSLARRPLLSCPTNST